MFLWRNVANYPRIIPVTPFYLELCVIVSSINPFVVSRDLMTLAVHQQMQGYVICGLNYSRPSLSRLRLSRITAYLEEEI